MLLLTFRFPFLSCFLLTLYLSHSFALSVQTVGWLLYAPFALLFLSFLPHCHLLSLHSQTHIHTHTRPQACDVRTLIYTLLWPSIRRTKVGAGPDLLFHPKRRTIIHRSHMEKRRRQDPTMMAVVSSVLFLPFLRKYPFSGIRHEEEKSFTSFRFLTKLLDLDLYCTTAICRSINNFTTNLLSLLQ